MKPAITTLLVLLLLPAFVLPQSARTELTSSSILSWEQADMDTHFLFMDVDRRYRGRDFQITRWRRLDFRG